VRQRLTAVAALALLRRGRAPEFVDDSARVASDLVDVAFEMGGPRSRVACERRVAGDDVGRVSESERELGRSDPREAIVR
jgi:hypothetical protein